MTPYVLVGWSWCLTQLWYSHFMDSLCLMVWLSSLGLAPWLLFASSPFELAASVLVVLLCQMVSLRCASSMPWLCPVAWLSGLEPAAWLLFAFLFHELTAFPSFCSSFPPVPVLQLFFSSYLPLSHLGGCVVGWL